MEEKYINIVLHLAESDLRICLSDPESAPWIKALNGIAAAISDLSDSMNAVIERLGEINDSLG